MGSRSLIYPSIRPFGPEHCADVWIALECTTLWSLRGPHAGVAAPATCISSPSSSSCEGLLGEQPCPSQRLGSSIYLWLFPASKNRSFYLAGGKSDCQTSDLPVWIAKICPWQLPLSWFSGPGHLTIYFLQSRRIEWNVVLILHLTVIAVVSPKQAISFQSTSCRV